VRIAANNPSVGRLAIRLGHQKSNPTPTPLHIHIHVSIYIHTCRKRDIYIYSLDPITVVPVRAHGRYKAFSRVLAHSTRREGAVNNTIYANICTLNSILPIKMNNLYVLPVRAHGRYKPFFPVCRPLAQSTRSEGAVNNTIYLYIFNLNRVFTITMNNLFVLPVGAHGRYESFFRVCRPLAQGAGSEGAVHNGKDGKPHPGKQLKKKKDKQQAGR